MEQFLNSVKRVSPSGMRNHLAYATFLIKKSIADDTRMKEILQAKEWHALGKMLAQQISLARAVLF